ncbi:MAG: DUF4861 family protein, partial [Candidatus Cryptobacteroides sp.]
RLRLNENVMMRRLPIFITASLLLACAGMQAQTASRLCRLSDGEQVSEISSTLGNLRDSLGLGGPAVENSYMGLRLFFDDSGAIDLYSKSGRGLELEKYAWAPDSLAVAEYEAGGDFLDEGQTLGLGGIALFDGEKMVRLVATQGRSARVGTTSKGSFAEIVSKGVLCCGESVDVLVRVDVSTKKRDAWVTARVLNGEKVRFVTGLTCPQGQAAKTGKGVISVWGKGRQPWREVSVGLGLFYSEGVFGTPERADGMMRIISKPSTQIGFRVVGASSLEAELNSARRFETYMGVL